MLEPKIQVTQRLDFQDLMLNRVHEILLVASPYDAFILEEDGRLTEQILHEYLDMNFHYAPRVWQADTASSALAMLKKRDFDLIIVMLHLADMDTVSLCSAIKQDFPAKPIILLALDESEVRNLPQANLKKYIEKIFIWSGNSNVFPAIMKYIEDKQNAYRDIIQGDVRTIIFIEDSPRYYSIILPLIYKEIMYHTRVLVDKSLNVTQRLLHLRGRVKILVADNYESAVEYFEKYRTHVLGIISDIRFPKDDKLDKQAGIKFTEYVRSVEPYIPVILQSSLQKHAEQVSAINAHFLNKQSRTLLQDIRDYLIHNFGFGDFVFHTPKKKEIIRATDLQTLRESLEKISMQSLLFHSRGNHFSNWLAARGEFDLAAAIRPVYVEDFNKPEELRQFIIKAIDQVIDRKRLLQIEEFSILNFKHPTNFTRISGGSLGGKARGLAFMNTILDNSGLKDKYENVTIRIPRIVVIGTDEFDQFMDQNDLWKKTITDLPNEEILELFLNGTLPEDLTQAIDHFIANVNYPVAVRSSSLLEDSQYQPLAGMYSTYMLPNSSSKKRDRFNQLCEAIKRIYASIFFSEPKALIDRSGHRHTEEKMAVIIMELIGKNHDNNRYYPTFSGIARNINYYPVSYMNREEGYASIAVGFGRTVVSGENSLRFSPAYPTIIPQNYSVKSTIESSQNSFYALKLKPNPRLLEKGEDANLESHDLDIAESDGELYWSGSVVSAQDDMVRDSLDEAGTRVITFANILKWKIFPLTDILQDLLNICQVSLGSPVEIEFAGNLYRDKSKSSEFCLLQIKPLVIGDAATMETILDHADQKIIGQSTISLGNGMITDISHIVHVDLETFEVSKSTEVAQEIEYFNTMLKPKIPYILSGPGRWGTADPWLGIPVDWQQISGAKVIVELGMDNLPVDPSFGSHFFQNIASLRIGYLTINHKHKDEWYDLSKLVDSKVVEKQTYTRLIELVHPLIVNINGKNGEGLIVESIPNEKEIMDEQESSGI
ncbi:MAG: PEP/pyruvate-binding domain-containing protein [Candidatus Neomarinimicrobiota bacterium]